MEKTQNYPLTISGVHLELTGSIKEYVREKMAKLFAHEAQIVRIQVELKCSPKVNKQKEFTAEGHIQIYGPPMVAKEEGSDLYKSIDLLVLKLDRMLRRRSRLKRVKRKQLHDIEIPSELPKVSHS